MLSILTISQEIMPFGIELCAFSIVMELSGQDSFDIFFVCSQDQTRSYSPDLTGKGMNRRSVGKRLVPSCKKIVIKLVSHGSSYKTESKWHPGTDRLSVSSQGSDLAFFLYSGKDVSCEE